ncbi:MAG: HlyD family secretion protein [Parachlamydiaceae bacterium]
MIKKWWLIPVFLVFSGLILGFHLIQHRSQPLCLPMTFAIRQDLRVEVKTIGELEAARSTTVASSIKGDQGKIIDLICDGLYVQPGQVLARLDPTPFEEKVDKLQMQVKEVESYLHSLEQALEWESIQAEHKNRIALLEVESAMLELDKIKYGDGPQETSRLHAAMQKARLKFDELNAYANDLKELEEQGFLNSTEVKQAHKKWLEEKETYEIAKLQHDSYVQHVYPMQVKKGETHLKRAHILQEETVKSGLYQIAKSKALLEQAKQSLIDLLMQLQDAEQELAHTDIIAPAQGMVVLREEYRASQKRKPRIGDILVKNQPLIDLPDLSSMVIKTRVREVDLFKVSIGKKAVIKVDAYPQLTFTGSVTSIGVLALTDMNRIGDDKYFEVRITLDQSDPRLRPGMTTRASIQCDEALDILTIPLHSVFSDHDHIYCYTLNSKQEYEKRLLSLGISNEQWIEVKNGLDEAEPVCLVNPFY